MNSLRVLLDNFAIERTELDPADALTGGAIYGASWGRDEKEAGSDATIRGGNSHLKGRHCRISYSRNRRRIAIGNTTPNKFESTLWLDC